jgi:ribosomal protein S12 methylthiotransferase
VDGLLGTRRWFEIGSLIRLLRAGQAGPRMDLVALLDEAVAPSDGGGQRFARQGASAYLKIADGCSAPCAFCSIPLIKGPAVSLPAKAVVEDAVELVRQGVKELVLIAQDTTAYGRDRGERDALPILVQDILREVPHLQTEGDRTAAKGPRGLRWLRIMYAYPGHVSPRLVEVMAREPRVCNYLDLPLQHAHPDVLRRMKRPSKVKRTRRLIGDLRAAMPDIALRTSFIVGYPGETEGEFQALLDFVARFRPDRVGVFTYSEEEGTAAAALPDPVPEEVKAERYDRLMALQQRISLESNQAQIGRTLDLLVEGSGDGLHVGRCYRDAPEIDGLVFVPGDTEVDITGTVRSVQITGAMEYDLVGELRDSGEA